MSVPPAGAVLAGKYSLHRRLGSGGYGAVFEGENVDLGKKVAIKLIDRRHQRSAEAIARFRREARASAKVDSPHIVQVFDVGEDDAFGLYMVMELLRGEDLRKKLDRAGKLEVSFAVNVAHQIATGLARAHAAGVVHRDLKPANLFLHQPSAEADDTDEERIVVKIVDFGVAKLLDSEPDARDREPLTVAGKTVGTPQYMSPEQVQGMPYDHRGDLWALGAVLYEMIAGQPAYALCDTFQQTALAIVNEKPRPLRSLAPDAPLAVEAVIDRALSHHVDDRFPDATAFADALAEAMPAAIASAKPPPSVRRVVAHTPPAVETTDVEILRRVGALEDRRRRGVGLALSILAVAALILVLAALRTRRRVDPIEAAPPSVAASTVATTLVVIEPPAEPSVAPPAVTPAAPTMAPSAKWIVTEKPSASASTPIVKQPDQFGGAGLSSSY